MNLPKPKKSFKPKPKKPKALFLETYTIAPAPSRDYHGLKLFENRIIWLRWKISHGPSLRPLQNTVDLDDFLKDSTMQNEISYIFGSEITKLINDVALKNWTLSTMPSNILNMIFIFMTIKDIWNLMQVCKRLYKECCKNELWEKLCKRRYKILMPSDVHRAAAIGWRHVYKEKIMQKYNKSDFRVIEKKLGNKKKGTEILKQKPPAPESKSNTTLINKDKKKSDILRSASAIFPDKEPLLKVSHLNRSVDRPISSAREKSTAKKNQNERIASARYEGNSSIKSKEYLQVNEIKTKSCHEVENRISKMKVTSIKARPSSKQSEKIKK